MALITCKECGNLVSDKAIACPRCGYPMNTPEEVQTKQSVSTKTEGSGDKCTSDNGISHNNANCSKPIGEALCVDAACSGNPGKMEYRGVHIPSGKQIFHYGPVWGTNNIGEFLAIVHGLALLKQRGSNMPIYSDSYVARKWIEQKKCKTKLDSTEKSAQTLELVQRAEKWLRENQYSNPIEVWQTKDWGEIPADFGRK
ncbi:MAG: zinc-ribbon domain-containing protein [Bacteroidaceae bacterium]|nr:zinc-ribbon domain-containing protein [Bacteroidaceae bacterium]